MPLNQLNSFVAKDENGNIYGPIKLEIRTQDQHAAKKETDEREIALADKQETDKREIALAEKQEIALADNTPIELDEYILVVENNDYQLLHRYGVSSKRKIKPIIQPCYLDPPLALDLLNNIEEKQQQIADSIAKHRNSKADNNVLDHRYRLFALKKSGANSAGCYGGYYEERFNPDNKILFKQDVDPGDNPHFAKVYCEALITQGMSKISERSELIADVELAIVKEGPTDKIQVYLGSKLFKGYCHQWQDAFFAMKYLKKYKAIRDNYLINSSMVNREKKPDPSQLKCRDRRARYNESDPVTYAMIENERYGEGYIQGLKAADFFDDPDLHPENFGTVKKPRKWEVSIEGTIKHLIENKIHLDVNGIVIIEAKDENNQIYQVTLNVKEIKTRDHNETTKEGSNLYVRVVNSEETLQSISYNNQLLELGAVETVQRQRVEVRENVDDPSPSFTVFDEIETVRIDAGAGGGDERTALSEKRGYDGTLHFLNDSSNVLYKHFKKIRNFLRYHPSTKAGASPPHFEKIPDKIKEKPETYISYLRVAQKPEEEILRYITEITEENGKYFDARTLKESAGKIGVTNIPNSDNVNEITNEIKLFLYQNFLSRQQHARLACVDMLILKNMRAKEKLEMVGYNEEASQLFPNGSARQRIFITLNKITHLDKDFTDYIDNNKEARKHLCDLQTALRVRLLEAHQLRTETDDKIEERIHSVCEHIDVIITSYQRDIFPSYKNCVDAYAPLTGTLQANSEILTSSKELVPATEFLEKAAKFEKQFTTLKKIRPKGVFSNIEYSEKWIVAGCALLGSLLGAVIGFVAGAAVGFAFGGVLANIIGAITSGSTLGVIAALKGMGLGASIGTTIASLTLSIGATGLFGVVWGYTADYHLKSKDERKYNRYFSSALTERIKKIEPSIAGKIAKKMLPCLS